MTNLELITDAFRQIGMIDENESPSAEQGQVGLRRLNQLLAAWATPPSSICFPSWFPQTSLSDTLPIPDYAERAVTAALAIELCAAYQRPVSDAIAVVASNGYQDLLVRHMNQRLRPVDLSHLPAGEAHRHTFDIING